MSVDFLLTRIQANLEPRLIEDLFPALTRWRICEMRTTESHPWFLGSSAGGFLSAVLSLLPILLLAACTPQSTGDGPIDRDGDGFAEADDCDDTAATTYPGADELCNGIDEDCDDALDEDAIDASTWYADDDADSFGNFTDTITACERQDGYVNTGTDCDDSSSMVYPGAIESCNGRDDNCADGIDEDVKSSFYADLDGDGYGNPDSVQLACSAPADHVADQSDCDDTRAEINPGGTESCNGLDDNCDGSLDEGFSLQIFYRDSDDDTYGDPGSSQEACSAPPGYVENGGDCNDSETDISPDATEVCDLIDNDCDEEIDEDSPVNTYYRDADGDGFGDAQSTILACTLPEGYSSNATDCNDEEISTYPDAPEICNSVDDNCNDVIDEAGATIVYLDADGDGYGNPDVFLATCPAPTGYVGRGGDCDDDNASVNPGAGEICNLEDDNCDGASDEGIEYLDLASGEAHTLMLCSDGRVLAWGFNGSGQLGNEDYNDSLTPTRVEGITGATAIAAGYQHSLVITGGGTLWAWGYNGEGQLGDTTTTTRFEPVQVPGVNNVVGVAAGASHTLVLQKDGVVKAFGDNTHGQLGISGESTSSATVVPGLTGATQLVAGGWHSLAIDAAGGLFTWGANSFGQLGLGDTTPRSSPTRVSSLSGVASAASGPSHTLVVRQDGGVWAFGRNTSGQLGDGTTTQRNSPVQPVGLSGMAQVAGAGQHSLARDAQGRVWAWGANWEGQLGMASDTACDPNYVSSLICRVQPAPVPSLSGISDISAGYLFSLGLEPPRTVWGFGSSDHGQLGNGGTTAQTTPSISFGD